ncbi:polyphosphate kinase 2 family protein [soil metagenome]
MDISSLPTKPTKGTEKRAGKDHLKTLRNELAELQNMFYADGRFGLLIVLQGMDASGKDGVCRHVMSAMNPMGVQVTSFKKPTEAELDHDFLWRIYPHFPARGMIEVFNRSYYEDILMPMVGGDLSQVIIDQRFELINAIERHLEVSNIHVLKFFLHISREEQKERIVERKTIAHKKWKYSHADEFTDKKWNTFQEMYNYVLGNSSHNPWHIIPADKRWYRNEQVALVIRDHLKGLGLEYPG